MRSSIILGSWILLSAPAMAQTPTWTLRGSTADDRFGAWVTALDVDGDGVDELAIGASGEDTMTGGMDSGAIHVVRADGYPIYTIDGGQPNQGLHRSLRLGDLSNPPDGIDEFATLAYGDDTPNGAGLVRVFNGATGAPWLDAGQPGQPGQPREHAGTGMGTYFGFTGAKLHDVDGDMVDDYAITAFAEIGATSNQPGVIHIYSGDTGLKLGVLESACGRSGFGYAIIAGQDLNGDGTPDLVASELGGSCGGVGGLVEAYDGATLLSSTPTRLWGVAANDSISYGQTLAFTPDMTGDGLPDVLVGAPRNSGTAGAVWLLDGTTGGNVRPFHGLGNEYLGGSQIVTLERFDGDEVPDFLFVTGYADRYGASAGMAQVHPGVAPTYTSATTSWLRRGDPNQEFGTSATSLGDSDGDGVTDFAIGAAGDDTQGNDAGAVFVYLSEPGTPWHEWKGEGDASDTGAGPPKDGTPENGTSFRNGVDGQAFSFDGVGGHVRILPGNLPNNEDFTIECWVTIDDLNGAPGNMNGQSTWGVYQTFLSQRGTSGGWSLYHEASQGAFAAGGTGVGSTPGSIVAQQWVHLALCAEVAPSTPRPRFYFNGRLISSGGGVSFDAMADLLFGADGVSQAFFYGGLDEVRLYRRALGGNEITSRYLHGLEAMNRTWSGQGPRSVIVFDANGDGHLDVLTANELSNDLTLAFGDGTGQVGSSVSIGLAPGDQGPIDVDFGDLDGNGGDDDLAVVCEASATVALVLNVGSGSPMVSSLGTGGSRPVCVRITDVDGQGTDDIVVGREGEVLTVGGGIALSLNGSAFIDVASWPTRDLVECSWYPNVSGSTPPSVSRGFASISRGGNVPSGFDPYRLRTWRLVFDTSTQQWRTFSASSFATDPSVDWRSLVSRSPDNGFYAVGTHLGTLSGQILGMDSDYRNVGSVYYPSYRTATLTTSQSLSTVLPTAIAGGRLAGTGFEPDVVVLDPLSSTLEGLVDIEAQVSIWNDPPYTTIDLGWQSSSRWQAGALPRALAMGDLDGDGIDEIVVANFADDDITILRVAQTGPAVIDLGGGCAGSTGVPELASSGGDPTLGNASFALELENARPSTVAALIFGPNEIDLNLAGSGCRQRVGLPFASVNRFISYLGRDHLDLAIPNDPAFDGVSIAFQTFVLDPNGTLFGRVALSNGLRVQIGN